MLDFQALQLAVEVLWNILLEHEKNNPTSDDHLKDLPAHYTSKHLFFIQLIRVSSISNSNVPPKFNIEFLGINFFDGISSRDVECTRSRILSYFKTTQKQLFITTSSWPTQNTLLRPGTARTDLECPEAGP